MTLKTYNFSGAGPAGTTLTTGNTGASQITANGSAKSAAVSVFGATLAGAFQANNSVNTIGRFAAAASNLTMAFGVGLEYDSVAASSTTDITMWTLRYASGVTMKVVLQHSTHNIVLQDAGGINPHTLVTGASTATFYWVCGSVTTTSTANTGSGVVAAYTAAGTQIGTDTNLSGYNLGTAAFAACDVGVVDVTAHGTPTVTATVVSFNDGSGSRILPPTTLIPAVLLTPARAAIIRANHW